MTPDQRTRVLFSAFTLGLLLNGLNPWLLPTNARANEKSPTSVNTQTADCTAAKEKFGGDFGQKENKNLKMRLISMEASLNDIQLTLKGIDRKINKLPSHYPKESR